jgi:hypothetical protein
MIRLLKKLKLTSIPLPLECLKLSHKQWDLMTYYTKFFLILFAVLGGFTLLMAFCIIVGNYAY